MTAAASAAAALAAAALAAVAFVEEEQFSVEGLLLP